MKHRIGANVEVFQRDPKTNQRKLVHTSFKKMPSCVACGDLIGGDAVLTQNGAMIHELCAKKFEVKK